MDAGFHRKIERLDIFAKEKNQKNQMENGNQRVMMNLQCMKTQESPKFPRNLHEWITFMYLKVWTRILISFFFAQNVRKCDVFQLYGNWTRWKKFMNTFWHSISLEASNRRKHSFKNCTALENFINFWSNTYSIKWMVAYWIQRIRVRNLS